MDSHEQVARPDKIADPISVETVPIEKSKPAWFQWHEPGTSREEKKLIAKLDWFLLSYSCLCFFIKQLDANNISNAYVSGMKEELHFGKGNELSWMNTYFNIGQILGGPIANMIITVIRPRYWLPSCLLVWSVFVLFLFKCETASEFYALRFCVGLFESAASPGIHYVLGCWRSALFVISGVLGQMFSGYLQSALYSGMQGKGGLSAWRWLFIFDFVLAVPIAIYGIFCFPDTPHTSKAWYLSTWERQRAIERIEEEGRKPIGKMDLTVLKRILTSWQVYTFSFAQVFQPRIMPVTV
ncbi:Pantothenate transporter [Lachnellula occidentalis]|uniref:Pantothenate transporter n=1 Tax=Lachnellula occidentalis TaxID=215460 RepID=A0A8H8S7A0_9HELO|nr:Pantothenate transporter [Lachnellula occidentalis]